jgi:hypothetical protein
MILGRVFGTVANISGPASIVHEAEDGTNELRFSWRYIAFLEGDSGTDRIVPDRLKNLSHV